MAFIDLQTLIIVGLAFAMGGVIKGATGAGAPLIAVPVMTSFFRYSLRRGGICSA